ncbi:MAG TPA: choice-of-anchor tandem repeat GloVer-containing protein, partial [Bacteroidia bacterium]|nr:choice-of-anchor tandem repeat GloVer-containing protein [Bacteroidia bacterium]
MVVFAFTTLTTKAQNYNLFGYTEYGGNKGNRGVLFRYNLKAGFYSTPVSYSDSAGTYPYYGSLNLDTASGLLLGTGQDGGRYSFGSIFSYGNCSGQQVLLNMQTNAPEGQNPYGNLTYDKNKKLFYGLTYNGGTYGVGTLFSFDPLTAKYTVIINFSETAGTYPNGMLTFNPNDNLYYGLASGGGVNNDGAVFSFDPATGIEKVLFSFNIASGYSGYNSLTYNPVTKLFYGFANQGGSNGYGTFFSFDPATNKDSVLVNLNS